MAGRTARFLLTLLLCLLSCGDSLRAINSVQASALQSSLLNLLNTSSQNNPLAQYYFWQFSQNATGRQKITALNTFIKTKLFAGVKPTAPLSIGTLAGATAAAMLYLQICLQVPFQTNYQVNPVAALRTLSPNLFDLSGVTTHNISSSGQTITLISFFQFPGLKLPTS